MKRNHLLSTLAPALLLLTALFAACTEGDDEPGGLPPGGRITLTPTVAPTAAWNTTDAGTRADGNITATLTAGGEIAIGIFTVGPDDQPGTSLGLNYFTVGADGKLERLPFNHREDETEPNLAVDAPGDYIVVALGEVILTTDAIEHGAYVRSANTKTSIGTDGRIALKLPIVTGGLRLNAKNADGTAYTSDDITATIQTVTLIGNDTYKQKTLDSTAPSAIWGDIDPIAVNAGDPLLHLVVGAKKYVVNAPRQISFTAGRLYTFNVRVGATSITVSSDDLEISAFEPEADIDMEAKQAPVVNGRLAVSVGIPE